jgi:hypothetical protein
MGGRTIAEVGTSMLCIPQRLMALPQRSKRFEELERKEDTNGRCTI